MEREWFSWGAIYQGPDHHYYTLVLQVEAGYWILGELIQVDTEWRLHEVVRPNGTRDRRCLMITAYGPGFRIVGVDVRSTPHLLYLDERVRTHFAVTTDDLTGLTYVGVRSGYV